MDFTERERYHKIVIQGVVQGMGFRPFVLRQASRFGIRGTVRNTGGSLLIMAAGSVSGIEGFIRAIRDQSPVGSRITDMSVAPAEPFLAKDFHIAESGGGGESGGVFLLPDLGICEECLEDLSGRGERRQAHPFNSCVACGPRFTIIRHLPYDRENTSMDAFPLCEDCGAEYASPGDRRCHAQTVCCNRCGPRLRMYDRFGGAVEGAEAFGKAVAALSRGEILALKGVGGYHFACSSGDREAVRALRALKGRDKKPFAVMFRDMDAIREVCRVGEEEERLLTSPARPITLLEMKGSPFPEELLFGDVRCGCFLPYTALHHLLLGRLGRLVLTSANSGGGAIIKDDPAMEDFFKGFSGEQFTGVLLHDREILRAAEDSVAQVPAGRTQLLRRSRGYVPEAVILENRSGRDFIALGGDLKAAYCLVKGSYAYQGPYMGDLEEKSVYDRFRSSSDDFTALLGVKPSFAVCDLHPGYFSSVLAEEWGLPIMRVQHHHAHITSVMAEHGLREKAIGVAFDGTGYGQDGCLWGGEFLVCQGQHYRRAGHLEYTTLLGGDSGAKDARKSAFCFLHGGADGLERFDSRAGLLAAALNANVNTVQSSSMGRLFDAIAAILGLGDWNSYEGEAAMLLQRCAEKALRSRAKPYPLAFGLRESEGCLKADGRGVALELFQESSGRDYGALALGFHLAVAELVKDICLRLRETEACDTVVLSGGVFQNKLLLELTLDGLAREDFRVYINNMTSPNDGGISLGQAYVGAAGFSGCS